jgi:hypothetical protein
LRPADKAIYSSAANAERVTLASMDADQSVRAALDPVLVNLGFGAGQGGGGDDADIIWCAAYTDFQRRFPTLPQAREEDHVGPYACVDLTVRLGLGCVIDVDLEGCSLVETFEALDRPTEAKQARRLLGSPAGVAAVDLVTLLADLFAEPAQAIVGVAQRSTQWPSTKQQRKLRRTIRGCE